MTRPLQSQRHPEVPNDLRSQRAPFMFFQWILLGQHRRRLTNLNSLSIPTCMSKTSNTFSSWSLDIAINYKYLLPADLSPSALNFHGNKSASKRNESIHLNDTASCAKKRNEPKLSTITLHVYLHGTSSQRTHTKCQATRTSLTASTVLTAPPELAAAPRSLGAPL